MITSTRLENGVTTTVELSALDWLRREGPRKWRELHSFARDWEGDVVLARQFLEDFAAVLPCGSCRSHWLALVQRHPPDLSSAEAFFVWTVDRHNDVNARRGTALLSVAAARVLYAL